jgi:pyruvate dehydrogenase E1 component beta subunit
MPASSRSITASYEFAINNHKGPVVMLEHRLMYELEFEGEELKLENPLFGSILENEGTDVTVVATSVMVLEAKRAAKYLEDYGISVEIIDLHSISHPDKEMILSSVRKTGKLLVADTSWAQYGVSAEISRIINESDPSLLKSPSISLGMQPAPCPTAKALENLYYPDVHDLVDSIASLHFNRKNHLVPLPEKQSMTDYYKHFKGPF